MTKDKTKKRVLNKDLEPTFTGIFIPKEVWLCEELTPIQMLLMMQIKSLDNTFGCTATNNRFAEFFGVSDATISEHIQNLVSKDFLNCEYDKSNRRTMRVSRKFRLIIAGLNEDLKTYSEKAKEEKTLGNPNTSSGNTETSSENTEHRITLEQHLDPLSIVENPESQNSKIEETKKDQKSKTTIIQKIEETKNYITASPLYQMQIDQIKSTNPKLAGVPNVDELALCECALAMVSDGKQSVGNPINWLNTAYSKVLSGYISSQRAEKVEKELAITEGKEQYFKDKKNNPTPQKYDSKGQYPVQQPTPAYYDNVVRASDHEPAKPKTKEQIAETTEMFAKMRSEIFGDKTTMYGK